jgi:hypothetical protein
VAQSEYQAEYWKTHRELLCERRRKRYAEDADVRARVRERGLLRYERLGKAKHVVLHAKHTEQKISPKEASAALGVHPSTFCQMAKSGAVPPATYTRGTKQRAYSVSQLWYMEKLYRFFKTRKGVNRKKLRAALAKVWTKSADLGLLDHVMGRKV